MSAVAVTLTGADLVAKYFALNYQLVTWPAIGDAKGPRDEGWTTRQYTPADYHEGYRVGIMTGVEVETGKFLHDVDIDWVGGACIAQKLIPETGFAFGRASKPLSHCFYLLPGALVSFRYEDIDGTCLVELRGTKKDGTIGLQTMVPPSVWTKDGRREDLVFLNAGLPTFHELNEFRQRICLIAIGMLLVKHLGHNGFGHDVQLAFAGFMLRLGIPTDEIILLAEAIGEACNHVPLSSIRRDILSTAERMNQPGQRIKGGPALAKIIGEKAGKKVIARINEWLGRDSDFVRTKDGDIIKDHQDNVRRAVQLLEVEFSYDTYAEKTLIQEGQQQRRSQNDHLLESLWLRIDREYHFRPTWAFFEIVTRSIAHDNEFHPVCEYLDSLTWDGEPRIDSWLITSAEAKDSEYVRAISSIMLIAAVSRVRDPGCKYDEMVVLESGQGLNKSSMLRALCPNDDWFSDDLPLNVDAKQIIERTLGKWIIEASDLVGGRKADRDHLKSMLSRQVDGPARMAYAHTATERRRQFIIVGTTNSTHYSTDPTGARRFWPVKVKSFKLAWIKEHRDQLWAEACVRQANGESIRLPEKLWPAAGKEQDARRVIDPWEPDIRAELAKLIPDSKNRLRIYTNKIWTAVGMSVEKRKPADKARIADIMRQLGYTSRQWRESGGDPEWGYVKTAGLDYGDEDE